MKHARWLLALVGVFGLAASAQAQFYPYPIAPGGYYNRGIGISYFNGRIGISGYFARPSYGYNPYPFFPAPQVTIVATPPPPPIWVNPPIILNRVVQQRDVQPANPNPVDDNGNRFDRIEPRRPQPNDRPLPGIREMPDDDRPLPGQPAGRFRPIDPMERDRARHPAQPGAAPDNAMPKQPAAAPAAPLQPAKDPKEEVARLIALGKQAFAEQQYGLAERRFQRATEVNAKEAMGHFLLAQARFALGQYKEAVDSIHTGMRLRVEWPLVRFSARELYGPNADSFREHLFRLDETVARNPKDANLLFLYGYQLWFDGQQEEARKYFRRAADAALDRTFINRFLNAMPGQPIARGQ